MTASAARNLAGSATNPRTWASGERGSTFTLGATLDLCFAQAGRAPDAVFAAHAHNYQRFTRSYQNRLIPHVVAGTGGYPDLHQTATHPREMPASFHELPDVTLERYQDTDYGFLTITAGPAGADVVYSLTTQQAANPFDSFSITPGGHHPSTDPPPWARDSDHVELGHAGACERTNGRSQRRHTTSSPAWSTPDHASS
jgi:hypothetical protein